MAVGANDMDLLGKNKQKSQNRVLKISSSSRRIGFKKFILTITPGEIEKMIEKG